MQNTNWTGRYSLWLLVPSQLIGQVFTENDFQINETRPEFEGDYTVVLFALVKSLKVSPEILAKNLGENLLKNNPGFISGYNIIKAFLYYII